MTGIIEIKFDEKRLGAIHKMLWGIPKAMPRVMSRGVNRTASQVRTDAGRRIREQVRLKAGTVRASIDLTRATFASWIALIEFSGRRVPLIEFGARASRRGVSYAIGRSGGRGRLESGFIARGLRGKEAVFARKGRPRLPIMELFGPSVAGVFETTSGLAKAVEETAASRLGINIDQQIARILERRGG